MRRFEKKYELTKINAAAVFKITTLTLALAIGLVGLGYIFLSGLTLKYKQFGGAVLGTIFGVLILSPAYGLVLSLLAAVYNFIAAKFGGYKITLNIEEKDL